MAPGGTYSSVGIEVLKSFEKRSLDIAARLVTSHCPSRISEVRNVRIQ
jgi:hypothetical protein